MGVDGFRHVVEMAAVAKGVLVGCRRAWYHDPKSPYKGQHIARAEELVLVELHALDKGSRDALALMLKNTMEGLLADRRWHGVACAARRAVWSAPPTSPRPTGGPRGRCRRQPASDTPVSA